MCGSGHVKNNLCLDHFCTSEYSICQRCNYPWMCVIALCVNSNILLNWLCNSYSYVLFSKFSSPTSEDEHVANHRLEPLDEVDPTAQSITNKVSLTTFWNRFKPSRLISNQLRIAASKPSKIKMTLHKVVFFSKNLPQFILTRKIWRTFCKNGEKWNGIWQQKSILTLGCYTSQTSW